MVKHNMYNVPSHEILILLSVHNLSNTLVGPVEAKGKQ